MAAVVLALALVGCEPGEPDTPAVYYGDGGDISTTPDVTVIPVVTSAHLQLKSFRLLRISQLHGSLVHAIGDEARKIIEQMAESTDIPLDDIFQLLCIFFKLDAGSYTENAGGIKSLDHLFIFDEKNKNISFSSDINKRIDLI